jgi:hypothetical protein
MIALITIVLIYLLFRIAGKSGKEMEKIFDKHKKEN